MTSNPLPLNPPRIEHHPAQRLIGLVERYEYPDLSGIFGHWKRFSEHAAAIAGIVDDAAFGVSFNDDGRSFDYLTGVLVGSDAAVPAGLVAVDLPAQKYAAFRHDGNISEFHAVLTAIRAHGLSAAGLEPATGALVEKYGPEFDPVSGLGGFEIQIAVK